jgi:predicted secreted protein
LLWANWLQAADHPAADTQQEEDGGMNTIPSLGLIAASLVALSACATPAPSPLRTVTDVDADAGVIELARGQDLEIALPLNSGTGYAWRLDHEAPPLLGGGSSFMTDARAPGAPVRTVYRYTGLARGQADLAFTLKRPWEADQPGDRKVVFHVRVR